MAGSAYGFTMIKSDEMKRKKLPNHNHPLAKALLYTIILFAVIHLSISFFVGVLQNDSSVMNMFHVLGMDLIWPELGQGSTNALLAGLMLVIVWSIMAYLIISLDAEHRSSKSKK